MLSPQHTAAHWHTPAGAAAPDAARAAWAGQVSAAVLLDSGSMQMVCSRLMLMMSIFDLQHPWAGLGGGAPGQLIDDDSIFDDKHLRLLGQVSVAVLLDNFVTASTVMQEEGRGPRGGGSDGLKNCWRDRLITWGERRNGDGGVKRGDGMMS